MKLALATIVAAAFAVSTSLGADDVNVMGSDLTKARDDAVRVATHDLLDQPTGLVNKNTVFSNNNIFIARSNIFFTQSDRMAMRKKVRDVLKKAKKQDQDQEQSSGVDATATLTKSVLRAVSASDKDSALMTKASAVVAAKDADASTLAKRIADFVDAAGKREMETEQEQAIQSQTPRGVIVLVGTKDILRQPTAAVNKNIAKSDNQLTISRSDVKPTQNDHIMLVDSAKVSDLIASASAINVDADDKKMEAVTETTDEPQYRQAFVFPKDGQADETMKNQEQFGLWGAGWGLGWRYPLGYWNTIGFGLYGGGCGLGFPMGGFYYC